MGWGFVSNLVSLKPREPFMTVKEGKLVPRMSCRRDSWKLDDFQQTTNIKIISTIKKISVVLKYCAKNRI